MNGMHGLDRHDPQARRLIGRASKTGLLGVAQTTDQCPNQPEELLVFGTTAPAPGNEPSSISVGILPDGWFGTCKTTGRPVVALRFRNYRSPLGLA